MKLIAASAEDTGATALSHTQEPGVLVLENTADPREASLDGITRIDLHFPKFTDGRAYSQAYLLRRRLGYTGELRATGDVLVDQVLLMQRSGFDSAVLRPDQDISVARAQLERFGGFYQGDAAQPQPLFARSAA